jgi:outer membrane protein OmpA-like peptidoglycan-associated protein
MRANAVKKLIIDLGAPAENIAIVTRGEKEPEESNKTEEGRAHNRRATVEIE